MSTRESPSIAQRVVDLRAGFADQLPHDVAAKFAAEQAGLDRAGLPAGVAEAGTPLPDGELLDVHGNPTSLADQRHGRPAVVVFYRGEWCPYCNLTLRAYQEQLAPVVADRGVELIAISPEKPDASLTMTEKNELAFTVVSDPGNQIATKLGILTAPTEEVRAIQRTLGLDLAERNADRTYGIPMPTVLIVDAEGVIRWIDVHPNYTARTETPEILAALSALS